MRTLDVLLDRFAHSVLPIRPADVAGANQFAAQYERTLKSDGRWPDLNYGDRSAANWVGGKHLTRVLIMAKSVRLRRDAGKPDSQLTTRTLAALTAWTGPDPQNPNWWWNRIGVPELAGEIAAVMGHDLPPEELAAEIKILKRSTMDGETGANLAWCAINQVILGCLEKSPAVTRAAYERLYDEVRFADAAGKHEGIQPDYSFHQHGAQLYSGGYGLFYANDIGRFIYVSWGTPFQIPDEKKSLFDAFMLDGMRWMTRGNMLDYNTIGRTITRPGITAAPEDWSLGPISPAGPAYSLGNVAHLLSTLPGPRQTEYANWAACLANAPDAETLTGNKHFWCSDYMVDRRKSFMTSVKMFSTRIQNAEIVNVEGRLSHHLSDGANFLYLNGHEYEDVFPSWDWQKVPGTTAEQVTNMNLIEPHAVGTRGRTSFVGGVSDGTHGLCAMDLQRGALRARKAWFFFDDAYVCLGAGITVSNDHLVVTAVNQERLLGQVFDSESAGPLAAGARTLQTKCWVYHGHVGYLFADGGKIVVSNQNQTGRWSDFGAGSRLAVTQPVFNLWIDHGAGCKNSTYEYTVLPGATLEQTKERANDSGLDALSNRADVQAVYCPPEKLAEIAFWNAGGIETPLGKIEADRSCLLLVQAAAGRQLRVTVSNPENKSPAVNVRVGGQRVEMVLPSAAGSSVSKELAE